MSCFYGSDLLVPSRDLSPSLQKDWEKVALSELKPLKYCLYTIRYEFLKFAQYTELMGDLALSKLSRDFSSSVGPKITDGASESNIAEPSDLRNVKTGKNSSENMFLTPLETFFPFDPCYLISLHHYIDKYYRPWRGIPGINADSSTVDALSHADEEETSSYFMSTADGKQPNMSMSVASSNMSSIVSNTYYNKEYGMSGLSNLSFSMYGRSLNGTPELVGSLSKSANLTSAMSDGDDIGSFNTSTSNLNAALKDPGVRGVPTDEYPVKTTPMRRPRQYSISSTGSW